MEWRCYFEKTGARETQLLEGKSSSRGPRTGAGGAAEALAWLNLWLSQGGDGCWREKSWLIVRYTFSESRPLKTCPKLHQNMPSALRRRTEREAVPATQLEVMGIVITHLIKLQLTDHLFYQLPVTISPVEHEGAAHGFARQLAGTDRWSSQCLPRRSPPWLPGMLRGEHICLGCRSGRCRAQRPVPYLPRRLVRLFTVGLSPDRVVRSAGPADCSVGLPATPQARARPRP